MDFELFIGRFHPLVVHLPIGFILLAAILEILNQRYRDEFHNLDTAISITLFCGGAGAVLSAIIGYLLSQDGGYDEQTLFWHQWLGIGLGIFAFFGWAVKKEFIKLSPKSSPLIIVSLVVFVSIVGHLGGNLTHGSDYLLSYAPKFVQTIAGMDANESKERIPTDPNSIIIFQHLIQPVLSAKCISCHNKTKSKGDLILTSFKDLEKGGDDGHIIVGGNPLESNLFIRTTLPRSSKKFMPPKGEPLTYAEIKVMQWWIEIGASAELKLTELEIPEEIKQLLLRDYKVDSRPKPYFDQVEILLLSEDNFLLLAKAGYEAEPLSSIHNFIQVKSNLKKITSDQIQTLLVAKEQITWLNLKGKSVDDGMMKTIAKLTKLTTLELNNNPISDDGIKELKDLKHLEVLNLYGTEITDKALETIKVLPALKRVYLWQTKVAQAKIDELQKELANVKIINGISKNSNADNKDEI